MFSSVYICKQYNMYRWEIHHVHITFDTCYNFSICAKKEKKPIRKYGNTYHGILKDWKSWAICFSSYYFIMKSAWLRLIKSGVILVAYLNHATLHKLIIPLSTVRSTRGKKKCYQMSHNRTITQVLAFFFLLSFVRSSKPDFKNRQYSFKSKIPSIAHPFTAKC